MEILIILLLILLNGLFAMVEIAIVSSRKSKLRNRALEGDKKAETALELSENPNKLLSTAQVGITLIGILAGAFGGATIAQDLSVFLKRFNVFEPYAEVLSLGTVVLAITLLTIVLGELVPKRIALTNPERIGSTFAPLMKVLSQIAGPLVRLLSALTEGILNLLQIRSDVEPPVSEEEVKMLIREGTKIGVFDKAERDIMERTLRLADRSVESLMTPRAEIEWIPIESSNQEIKEIIIKHPHSHFPVCVDSLDNIKGVIRTEEALLYLVQKNNIQIEKILRKPLFVPQNLDALKLLELFKKSGIHMALVIDEYGNLQGLLSLTDLLESIVGDIPTLGETEEKEIYKRDKNSWFVDGLTPIEEFKDFFRIKKLPGEKTGEYHTIGGFAMYKLGSIPNTGDQFEIEDLKLEVVDMDGNRVDKLILSKI